MDEIAIAIKLQETTDRSLRNEGRVKKLEGEHEVLHELATSMAVMAEKQGRMGDSVERLEHKVDTLEDKPAQRSEIPDTEAPGEATAEDYQSALREMGVEV